MHAKAQVKNHSILNFDARSVLMLATVAAISIGLASAVHAQTPAPIPANKTTARDVEAAFTRADVDRDGRLSRSEAERFPMVVQRFEQFDQNRDGFLSRDEFNAAAGL